MRENSSSSPPTYLCARVQAKESDSQNVQNVNDDANRPHIYSLVVRLGGQHLGRDVARRAARGHELLLTKVLGETKVGNLDDLVLLVAGRKQVLGLHVRQRSIDE